MEHNYITLDEHSKIKRLMVFQKDNNLDGKDNLDTLPSSPAVYAVCGRVNGQPANPRFVGETENLREAVKLHFDKSETGIDEYFKEFMLSIKSKELLYEELPDSSQDDRMLLKKKWESKFNPQCNKELNEIH